MKKYENNVATDKEFYLANGKVLKNLKDLYNEIKQMTDDVFFHHVNSEKNDFSNWVRDVMNEKALSSKMLKAGTPVMMKEVLKGLFEKETKTVKAAVKKSEPVKKTAALKKSAAPRKTATAKSTSGKVGGSKKA